MEREGGSGDPVDQIEGGDMLGARLWEDSDPRIFSTNPDNPDEGRTFIWTQVDWFERIEGEDADGAVEFSPLLMDEHQLREWLGEQGEPELDELDNEYAAMVREEFLSEDPLYAEAPELSNQEQESHS